MHTKPRRCSNRMNRVADAILSPLGLLLVLSVGETPASAQDGTKCEAPRFEVAVESDQLAKVTAFSNSDAAEEFCLYFSYLKTPEKKGNNPESDLLPPPELAAPLGGDPTRCNPATMTVNLDQGSRSISRVRELAVPLKIQPEGTSVKLDFRRERVLKAGGFLGFRYQALGKPACDVRGEGPTDPELKVLDKHKMAFDVGSVLSLEGDGSWSSQAEATATFVSRWYINFSSGVSFRYSAIGAISDTPEEPADGEETPAKEIDPFQSGGGTFESGIFASWLFSKNVGFSAGVGFATLPGEASGALVAKNNYFVALRAEVEAYNSGRPAETLAGASGWLQGGLLWDGLFEDVVVKAAEGDGEELRSDESERFFVEGELEVPRVGTNWFRMLVRIRASVPTSGDGPSDVRVSVLGSIDPTKWFEGARGEVE